MKRLFIIFLCIAFITSCTTATTQVQSKDGDVYTFKTEKWQSFFYQDDEKTGMVMYQVEDLKNQQIPNDFKVGERVYKIKAAYPKIETQK